MYLDGDFCGPIILENSANYVFCVCVAWYTLYVQGYEEFCSKETFNFVHLTVFQTFFFILNQFIIKINLDNAVPVTRKFTCFMFVEG